MAGVVISGASDGHVRASATANGSVLWDFDTAVEMTTVNGVKAKGGAIGGYALAVTGSTLLVNSGSPIRPGNLLFAFTVDGK